jgi:hypothetical protein
MPGEDLPDGLREHYEDAIRVLAAVGVQASHVDEETARRALQFTTQVLRNLFEIPAERAPRSEPDPEPAPGAGHGPAGGLSRSAPPARR